MTSLLPLALSALVFSGSAGVKPGRIVWTIDDGPHRRATTPLLNLFGTYRIRAIWFVAGFHLPHPQSQKMLREIVKRGHLLGNHLWTHKSPCKTLTLREVMKELRKNDARVKRLLRGPWHRYRSQMRKWYRPPYGHRCRRVRLAMRKAGYNTWMWHVSDTDNLRRAAATIRYRSGRGLRTIVLWHHRWRKLRALMLLLEKSGHLKRHRPTPP